jgi:hypothetical protein
MARGKKYKLPNIPTLEESINMLAQHIDETMWELGIVQYENDEVINYTDRKTLLAGAYERLMEKWAEDEQRQAEELQPLEPYRPALEHFGLPVWWQPPEKLILSHFGLPEADIKNESLS